jgi:hypothetical protein
VLLAACGPLFDGLRWPVVVTERLTSILAQPPGTRVDLSDITPFGWRQVCIVGPNTPLAVLKDSLGLPTEPEVARGIERQNDIDLLVFRFEHVPPASIAFHRQRGGFAAATRGRCYSHVDPQFIVMNGSAGSPPEFGRLR